MAFGTTGLIDDFDRTNAANLGASWTTPFRTGDVSPLIDTNTATNGAGTSTAYYNAASYGPDMEAYADIDLPTANLATLTIYIRVTGSGATASGYGIIYSWASAAGSDTLKISRLDNGVATTIGPTYTLASHPTAGDFIGIEAIGSTITGYFKAAAGSWIPIVSAVDSTYSSAGTVALRFAGSTTTGATGRMRSLSGGTSTNTAPTIPTLPTTSVLDDFNRADGALGANWSGPIISSQANTFTILSNAIEVPSSTGGSVWWNPTTFGPDLEVFCSIPTIVTGCTLYVRITNPNSVGATDGYILSLTSKTTIQVIRIDNDTLTNLGAVVQITSFANGDSLGGRAVGSNLEIWTKQGGVWGQRIITQDATYSTAGYIGLRSINPGTLIDDFGGGTIVPDNTDGGGVSVKLTPSAIETGPGDIYNAPGLFSPLLVKEAWF